MLDFTSSLYLGLWHPSASLRPWSRLTTGVPAALVAPPAAERVARRLAALQGCEAAALGTSTLHLFWDLFGLLAGDPVEVYIDAGAYPISRWAALQFPARGVVVRRVPHRNPAALGRLLGRKAGLAPGRRPVMVADGVCVCCGKPAPVAAYLEILRPYGGLLVLDDTQALGLLGRAPAAETPYGTGGGGSLQLGGLRGGDVILVSSLAKAFGVPMAVLSGSREWVRRVQEDGQTQIHSSPPSAAHISAAECALEINARAGEELRRRLAARVTLFRDGLGALGLSAGGGLFPMQSLAALPLEAAQALHGRLLDAGLRTALVTGGRGKARIRFIITARHAERAIERAVETLAGLNITGGEIWNYSQRPLWSRSAAGSAGAAGQAAITARAGAAATASRRGRPRDSARPGASRGATHLAGAR